MTLSHEYTQLKQKVILDFVNYEKHDELLNIFKKLFVDQINSTRRYEQIKTIGQLINVLELRYAISKNDVTLLKYFAQRLPNSEELIKRIENYEKTRKIDDENMNSYSRPSSSMQNNMNESYITSVVTNPYTNSCSEQKKQRIFNTINEQIGIYWRDLGRNLSIPEGIIDDIDSTNGTESSKASKLLQKYETRSDPQRWFFKLCSALEKSRRKDLSRKLQKIMTMNL